MRTAPGTIWLLAAAIVLTVGVSTGAAAATRCPSGAGCPVDVTKLSLTGAQVGQASVAILAVLMVGAEYSAGMIRTTLSAMPRRSAVLAAKAAILTGLVLAAGTAGVAGSVLGGRIILPGHGFNPASGFPLESLAHGPVLRAAGALLLGGVVLSCRDA
jgi:ABC-2 type transport system permease protein